MKSCPHPETGRTSEQGRDYLIELDGDLLSVYGLQSLKFLDRPWNRMRAMKVQADHFDLVLILIVYVPPGHHGPVQLCRL